jgi:hypothetical protein
VEDLVGLNRANDTAHRAAILQLTVDHVDLAWFDHAPQAGLVGDALAFVQDIQLPAMAQVLEVVQLAAPAERAKDLNVRVVVRQILGQEASGHARNAGDQDAHRLSLVVLRTLLRQ